MCTTLKTLDIPIKATEPITCFKVLHGKKRHDLRGPYSWHQYQIGTKYECKEFVSTLNEAKSRATLDESIRCDNLSRPLGPNKMTISYGAFHTFVSRDEATRFIREECEDMDLHELVRCEIPTGALYLKGSYPIYSNRVVAKKHCGSFNCERGKLRRSPEACSDCYVSISSYLSSALIVKEVIDYKPKS